MFEKLFMGCERSGKTTLLKQYNQHVFDEEYKPTENAYFITKEIKTEDRYISAAQFWDTAGSIERLQSLGSTFYRTADCCVFVFDVSNEASFKKLDSLKDFFWSACDKPKIHLIVIGNKTDVPNRRISTLQAEAWCRANGNIRYFECNAKDPKQTEKVFKEIVRITMDEVPLQTRPQIQAGPSHQIAFDEPVASTKTHEQESEDKVHLQQQAQAAIPTHTEISTSQVQQTQTETEPTETKEPIQEEAKELVESSASGDQSYTVWIGIGAAVACIA
eukprot:CAMPEP_0168573234 /NCGR_PEP_ID=MMETSP0413-20121227/18412_1 /TAXON_ID=136452 /ORGANISM="Filamoeba nolandi, Strain NC-AS-23-1" /LENGTH=274 /DNA_ID=CAMNT_0008606443 /DNA_START=95 /DNA_END=916 /DNA_ORIENTATION=+